MASFQLSLAYLISAITYTLLSKSLSSDLPPPGYRDDFCNDRCDGQSCESRGTLVRCVNCGDQRDPVTCKLLSEINCDKKTCQGMCSPLAT